MQTQMSFVGLHQLILLRLIKSSFKGFQRVTPGASLLCPPDTDRTLQALDEGREDED